MATLSEVLKDMRGKMPTCEWGSCISPSAGFVRRYEKNLCNRHRKQMLQEETVQLRLAQSLAPSEPVLQTTDAIPGMELSSRLRLVPDES